MENAVCTDYITEKFWRPLAVGTVPITLGAPNIKEFAPSNRSIIDIQDYRTVKDLVSTILELDRNDTAYEQYREFKKTGLANAKLERILQTRKWEPDFDALGTNNYGTEGNFVNHFDCYICDMANNLTPLPRTVNKQHYGCPLPMEYISESNLKKQRPFGDFWFSAWMAAYCDVKAMLELSKGGKDYVSQEVLAARSRKCLLNGQWKGQHML
ncbi:alpha-(1,3)-fucosyltransferase 11-like [Watersipora subatra]|uniref:alpha-(1,3)-fucosyltransferase 11-like n=1 Tax=Watersipora subatra TaxID=2589382 RepID=UPI00355B83A8